MGLSDMPLTIGGNQLADKARIRNCADEDKDPVGCDLLRRAGVDVADQGALHRFIPPDFRQLAVPDNPDFLRRKHLLLVDFFSKYQ